MRATQRAVLIAAAIAMLATLASCSGPEGPGGENPGFTTNTETITVDAPPIFPSDTSSAWYPANSTETQSAWVVSTEGPTNPTQTSAKPSSSANTAIPSAATKGALGKYNYDYEGIHPAVAAYSEATWYLLLVNRDFALPAGYQPKTAVCLPGVYKENRELDARVAPEYRRMYNAALKDGAELIPFSGYRRSSTQKNNFEDKIAYYRNQGYSNAEAVNLAAKSILPPGCSEHEAGLSMDITRPGVWDTRVDFEDTKEFAWLMKNAADYGFILRYPKDKRDITKITYEPWHWRYVGAEAASVIMGQGLCLEEYLASR